MDVLATYSTDKKSEASGIWEDISVDASVLVARTGNRAYTRELTKQVDKFSMALEAKDDTADDVSEAIVTDCMAQHILLGWKGFTEGPDNTPVPYSYEKAKEYLANKDFRRQISKIADDRAKYKAKQEAAVSKN